MYTDVFKLSEVYNSLFLEFCYSAPNTLQTCPIHCSFRERVTDQPITWTPKTPERAPVAWSKRSDSSLVREGSGPIPVEQMQSLIEQYLQQAKEKNLEEESFPDADHVELYARSDANRACYFQTMMDYWREQEKEKGQEEEDDRD